MIDAYKNIMVFLIKSRYRQISVYTGTRTRCLIERVTAVMALSLVIWCTDARDSASQWNTSDEAHAAAGAARIRVQSGLQRIAEAQRKIAQLQRETPKLRGEIAAEVAAHERRISELKATLPSGGMSEQLRQTLASIDQRRRDLDARCLETFNDALGQLRRIGTYRDERLATTKKRKDEYDGKLDTLVDTKEQVLAELRAGYYCSKCMRTATEIETSLKVSFEQHLDDVQGEPVPASQEEIDQKEKEIDGKIADVTRQLERIDQEEVSIESDYLQTRHELEQRVARNNEDCNVHHQELARETSQARIRDAAQNRATLDAIAKLTVAVQALRRKDIMFTLQFNKLILDWQGSIGKIRAEIVGAEAEYLQAQFMEKILDGGRSRDQFDDWVKSSDYTREMDRLKAIDGGLDYADRDGNGFVDHEEADAYIRSLGGSYVESEPGRTSLSGVSEQSVDFLRAGAAACDAIGIPFVVSGGADLFGHSRDSRHGVGGAIDLQIPWQDQNGQALKKSQRIAVGDRMKAQLDAQLQAMGYRPGGRAQAGTYTIIVHHDDPIHVHIQYN